MIEFVSKYFNANVTISDERHLPGRENRKLLYSTRVQGKKALFILDRTIEYMITKKEIVQKIINNRSTFFNIDNVDNHLKVSYTSQALEEQLL